MPCPQCHSTCPPISCQKTATASEEKHDARPQKASLASGTDTEPGTDEVNNEQTAGQGAEVEVVTSLLFTRRVDTGTVIQQKRSAGTGRRHTGDADVAAAARGEGRSCQCLPGKAGALCARHWAARADPPGSQPTRPSARAPTHGAAGSGFGKTQTAVLRAGHSAVRVSQDTDAFQAPGCPGPHPHPDPRVVRLGGQAVKSPLLRGTSEPIPLGAPACLGLGKAGIRGGRHSPWPFIRMLTRTEDRSALLTPTVCLENLPDAKARRHPPLKQAPRPQEGPTSPGSASSSPWLLNREAPAAPALSPALSNRSDDSSAQRVHCEQALQSTGMAGRIREVTRHRHTRTHTLLTHAYTRARLPSGPHKTARDTDREAPWAPPRPACPPRLHASVCFGFLYRQQNRQERNNKKTGFFTQI